MCSFVCGRAYVEIRRCHLYTLLLCTPSQLALEPWRVSSSHFAVGALRFQMQVLVLGFVWVPGTCISGPHTCTQALSLLILTQPLCSVSSVLKYMAHGLVFLGNLNSAFTLSHFSRAILIDIFVAFQITTLLSKKHVFKQMKIFQVTQKQYLSVALFLTPNVMIFSYGY